METLDFVVTNIDTLAQREANPNWKINDYCNSNFYIIGFALSGKATYQIEDKEYDIQAGDSVFFHKGQIHTANSQNDDPWSFITVAFDISLICGNFYLPNIILHLPQTIGDKFIKLNAAWSQKNFSYQILCKALLQEILYDILLLIHQRSYDMTLYKRVNDARLFITNNLDKKISIRQLAELTECSESYFRKIFRSVMGISCTQYINQLKIQKAKDMMLTEDYKLMQVAKELGFQNIYYFSTTYKKITGSSPKSEYNKVRYKKIKK